MVQRLRPVPVARAARVVIVLVLALALGVLAVVGLRIQDALVDLRSTATDNLHWNLSQLEVDLVRLQEEARVATLRPDADLAELRRRFDLFYSRAQIAIGGKGYVIPALEDLFSPMVQTLRASLERETPLIDGPDPALRQALPEMQVRLATLRSEVRKSSITLIERLAQLSDERRGVFSTLVRQMVLATIATVALLAGLLALVVWLNRSVLRKARQTELVTERLTSTVESALDAIIAVDIDGRIIQFNPSAEVIFGYTRAEALGRDMGSLIIPEDLRDAHALGMARLRANGPYRMTNAGRIQTRALNRLGQEFPVELSISVADGEQGRIFISFLRDITDQLKAQSVLTTARDKALAAERAKTEFLAVMSHEMRTPLNGVIASLEIARRKAVDPGQKRFITLAQDSANQLLRHANDVLDITRMESGGLTLAEDEFDLEQQIRDLVESVRPMCVQKGISLDFTMLGDGAALRGDPFRLCQIVQNFLSNAMKFVAEGGIVIEVECTPLGDGTATVEVRVIDTGPGIAAADQDRIFQDFVMLDTSFRRAGEGSGLGLAIARRLARALGGEVGVESAPEEGSCFWLRVDLPLAEPRRAAGARRSSRRSPVGMPVLPARDVLVVEDNATNRAVMQEMLQGLGQRVTLANDGASGAMQAGQQAFDVIFMDISMPVMDGLAATALIRAGGASAHARIVAVTAHSLPADLARFREAGMDDVLVKPISSEALIGVLKGEGAAAAPAGDAVLLDAARIADLRASVGAAGLSRLAATFLRDGAGQVDRLNQALEQPRIRAEDMVALCHEAAGNAAVFGAARLARHYAEAEAEARAGKLEAARARLTRDSARLWAETRAAVQPLV